MIFILFSFLVVSHCKPFGFRDFLLGGAPISDDDPLRYHNENVPSRRDDVDHLDLMDEGKEDDVLGDIVVIFLLPKNETFPNSSNLTGWEGQEGVDPMASDEGGITFPQFLQLNRCKANIARGCFDDADTDKNGLVSNRELQEYNFASNQRAQKLGGDYADVVFDNSDSDGDGFISRDEAEEMAVDELRVKADKAFSNLFDDSDDDGDGRLDRDELRNLIGKWFRNDYSLGLTYNDYATTSFYEDVGTSPPNSSSSPKVNYSE